jgi:glycosidase
MLLTLPGNPFIYYGEEIGMPGVKPDEGIREPMKWTTDGQAKSRLPGSQAVIIQGIPELMWIVSLITVIHYWSVTVSLSGSGKKFRLCGTEEYGIIPPVTGVFMAFERITSGQHVLVIHNLTGELQSISLHAGSDGLQYSNILKTVAGNAVLNGNELTLPAYSSAILD